MILLDYKDHRPIYEQVAEKLQSLMICGVLEQDSQLPSVRSLAAELSINPNTIQRAYAQLERGGFIYSVKGRGSFVSDTGSIRALQVSRLKKSLELWLDEAKNSGVAQEDVHGWVCGGWNGKIMVKEEEKQGDKNRETDETVR